MRKKLISVLGATGAQGGGLVRAVLADPHSEFSVRAITRDVHSESAEQLAQMGAEVVAADLDDADSIIKAIEGSYGVFAVTFFWDHFSPDKEIGHTRVIAEAARRAQVKHVVWSTLEDTRKWIPLSDNRMPALMGKYKVPHFDAKGESDRFFIEAGVVTTFLLTSFFWDNMIHFGMGPKRDENGKLSFALPLGESKLAGIASEDIGRCAYAIFQAGPSKMAGKFIGVASDHISGQEIADELSQAFGEEVFYNAVTPAIYRTFNFPGAIELGNMFQFCTEYEQVFLAARDLEASRSLNPSMQNFSAWLKQNKNRIQTG